MRQVAYRSVVEVVRHGGPRRTAHLPAGEAVAFGVHSEIAQHYGVDPDQHPSTSTTLDYVVAAAAG
ncbi:MAG TPA: hypothetical protein VM287_10105 [Egibacteraceae bacterium]|nr:hypothetical protein [Egibacteraceae bacterium]